MGSNIKITNELEEYINNHSYKLNPIQKEIIKYNETLGEKKKMQISLSQCHLLHLIIKLCNPKKIYEMQDHCMFVFQMKNAEKSKSKSEI